MAEGEAVPCDDGTSSLRQLDVSVLPMRHWQYVSTKAKFLDSYESHYSLIKGADIFRNLTGSKKWCYSLF